MPAIKRPSASRCVTFLRFAPDASSTGILAFSVSFARLVSTGSARRRSTVSQIVLSDSDVAAACGGRGVAVNAAGAPATPSALRNARLRITATPNPQLPTPKRAVRKTGVKACLHTGSRGFHPVATTLPLAVGSWELEVGSYHASSLPQTRPPLDACRRAHATHDRIRDDIGG